MCSDMQCKNKTKKTKTAHMYICVCAKNTDTVTKGSRREERRQEKKENRSPHIPEPRRNTIIYHPIPNIFIPREVAREKRAWKHECGDKRMHREEMWKKKKTYMSERYFIVPSIVEERESFHRLALCRTDLQDDEVCPGDTRCAREELTSMDDVKDGKAF